MGVTTTWTELVHEKVARAHKDLATAAEAFESSFGEPGGSSCHARLVISRHGESEWNAANRFTGWVDVDLSEKGADEAEALGDLLKEAGLEFDVCYTSYLKRAIKTCNVALERADQLFVPVKKTWRLNERLDGALVGLDKKETTLTHGEELVKTWRRSFGVAPPVMEEDHEFNPRKDGMYVGLDPADIPKTESLESVVERVMPYWEEEIKPQLQAGKTVFVMTHGNTVRAMLKHIEDIPDDAIPRLEIPAAAPLVYELDKDLRPIPQDTAVAPLRCGRYLGDAEKIRTAAEALKNQTKVCGKL